MINEHLNDKDVLIIAEVGQNHQGSLENAIEYIKVFAACGADAIKFQTRNNKYLFTRDAYEVAYNSDNVFAEKYGYHREKLELRPEWLPLLKDECERNSVLFMSTPFDEPSLELLVSNRVDLLKIASFDLGNLGFIKRISDTKLPVILSVGGGREEHIFESVKILEESEVEYAILHCVSEYPCSYDKLSLDSINKLRVQFPNVHVGLSDHFNGILSGPIAYMKGARVFEKHVTLNRSWKGTDHSFALEPEGFKKFCRDIRRVKYMLERTDESKLGAEAVFKKLGKSVAAYRDIEAGEIITLDSLMGIIDKDQHIPVRDSYKLIGRRLNRSIKRRELIKSEDLDHLTIDHKGRI